MFVRSYSENAETSILIKLTQEKDALKQATSLLESEMTKQKDEVDFPKMHANLFFYIEAQKSTNRSKDL